MFIKVKFFTSPKNFILSQMLDRSNQGLYNEKMVMGNERKKMCNVDTTLMIARHEPLKMYLQVVVYNQFT